MSQSVWDWSVEEAVWLVDRRSGPVAPASPPAAGSARIQRRAAAPATRMSRAFLNVKSLSANAVWFHAVHCQEPYRLLLNSSNCFGPICIPIMGGGSFAPGHARLSLSLMPCDSARFDQPLLPVSSAHWHVRPVSAPARPGLKKCISDDLNLFVAENI